MKADEFLSGKELDFEEVEHEERAETCEQAAEIRGMETSQVVKSLIVERENDYVHCVVPGDRELSGRKFGEYRMVDPEKSEELTGTESGTVHPFSTDLKHFVDHRVFEPDRLSFTVGEYTRAVKISPETLRKAFEKAGFEYEVGDYVETAEEEIDELKSRGIDGQDATFVSEKGYRKIFLELSDEHEPGEVVAGLRKALREDIDLGIEELSELVEKSENETHMQKLAETLASEGKFPEEEEGFDLEETVLKVLEENPGAVEDYREGRDSAINYLLGRVMQRTNGKADGGKAREKLQELLEQS